jgi:hypothetical protein
MEDEMAKFSGQHYEMTAKTLVHGFNKARDNRRPLTAGQMRDIYDAFEDMFIDDNPRFERRVFFQAVFKPE